LAPGEANRRIAALKAKYPARQPDTAAIRRAEHVELMLEAARAGIVLLRENGLLPVAEGAALVEFASPLESGILESGGMTGFGTQVRQHFPQLRAAVFGAAPYAPEAVRAAEALAQSAPSLILATRNAHLNPGQLALARRLAAAAKAVVLVCLRNPYDAAALPGVGTVICTCGDSAPSLQAAAEVLAGPFRPAGKLPVCEAL
jgi:beta-N-acetylhexosaminidase